jgi:hypothetical protein
MALHTQVAPDDCIEQYEQAAGERQEGGFLLLATGSALGVEMMALSVEMVLKAAYFRFIGYAVTRRIEMADLRDAERDIQSLGVSQLSQGFHNLEFWAEGLAALHKHGLPVRSYTSHGTVRSYALVAAQPMNGTDELELQQRAARLATNWAIGDRYKSLEPHASKQDLEDVFDDAMAIIHFYDQGRF